MISVVSISTVSIRVAVVAAVSITVWGITKRYKFNNVRAIIKFYFTRSDDRSKHQQRAQHQRTLRWEVELSGSL